MKATELKLGNYVHSWFEDDKDYVQIDLHKLKLQLGDENFFQPIPLSEEWLLKFGFEKFHVKNAFGQEYYYKGISIYFINKVFKYYIHTNRHWVEYESVHEIQNLFASFGNELKLK